MDLNNVVDLLSEKFSPVSIFLYGSRAKGDFEMDSDYEIGVLFSKDSYISRSIIRENLKESKISIYPFVYEDFLGGNPDTPFQKNIYLCEIRKTSKILYGEDFRDKLNYISIDTLNLIQEVRFNMGRGLSAIISKRNGNSEVAFRELYKSCFFGLRVLELFELKEFLISYNDIYNNVSKIDMEKYLEIVEIVYNFRKNNIDKIDDKIFFKNISFLNNFIESKIVDSFYKEGNIRFI